MGRMTERKRQRDYDTVNTTDDNKKKADAINGILYDHYDCDHNDDQDGGHDTDSDSDDDTDSDDDDNDGDNHRSTTMRTCSMPTTNQDDTINNDEIEDILYGSSGDEDDNDNDNNNKMEENQYSRGTTTPLSVVVPSPPLKKKARYNNNNNNSSSLSSKVVHENNQWNIMYTRLVDYNKKQNITTTNIPSNYSIDSKLSKWVSHQRTAYRRRELSAHRIDRLEKVGFWQWKTATHNVKWMEMYERLLLYHQKYAGNQKMKNTICYNKDLQLERWIFK